MRGYTLGDKIRNEDRRNDLEIEYIKKEMKENRLRCSFGLCKDSVLTNRCKDI